MTGVRADQKKDTESACKFWSDGVCVYIIIRVRNSLLSKIALFVANLFACGIVVTGIITGLAAMILVSLVILSLLIRYTLWNYWGQEHLIINTVSLSYRHHYGFIQTGFITKEYSKGLRVIALNQEMQSNGQSGSQLCFTSYDGATNLPTELYCTSFYIDEDDHKRLLELINDLFINETVDKFQLPHINLN